MQFIAFAWAGATDGIPAAIAWVRVAAWGGRVGPLVVRVLGMLDASLQDETRQARQLPVPARLKVGDSLDGLVVTALVADTGVNLLYQVRDSATRQLHPLKTLHPQRAQDPQERAMREHEAGLAAARAPGAPPAAATPGRRVSRGTGESGAVGLALATAYIPPAGLEPGLPSLGNTSPRPPSS